MQNTFNSRLRTTAERMAHLAVLHQSDLNGTIRMASDGEENSPAHQLRQAWAKHEGAAIAPVSLPESDDADVSGRNANGEGPQKTLIGMVARARGRRSTMEVVTCLAHNAKLRDRMNVIHVA